MGADGLAPENDSNPAPADDTMSDSRPATSNRSQLLLAALGALIVLACVGTGLYVSGQLQRTSQSTFVAKDVVADVLPPPMYLIEMRLVLSQAVEASLPIEAASLQLSRLEKEYRDRVTYWSENRPKGLDTLLLGQQHETAEAFIAGARRVMKQVVDGDLKGASDSLVPVHDLYLKHRIAVDATVKAGVQAAEQSMGTFERTASTARIALITMMVLGLGSMALLMRQLIRPRQAGA